MGRGTCGRGGRGGAREGREPGKGQGRPAEGVNTGLGGKEPGTPAKGSASCHRGHCQWLVMDKSGASFILYLLEPVRQPQVQPAVAEQVAVLPNCLYTRV